MDLLKDFYDYVESWNIRREAIYEEKGEGFVLVSFPEEGEKDIIYNVAIIFYEDNDNAEIYIRKQLRQFDELSVLRQVNLLNAEYCGITFFLDENMLTVKSHCAANRKIESIFKEMVTDMQVARKEFAKIELGK